MEGARESPVLRPCLRARKNPSKNPVGEKAQPQGESQGEIHSHEQAIDRPRADGSPSVDGAQDCAADVQCDHLHT